MPDELSSTASDPFLEKFGLTAPNVSVKGMFRPDSDSLIGFKKKPHPRDRGGLKLQHALHVFNLKVDDRVCRMWGRPRAGSPIACFNMERAYAVDVDTANWPTS